MRHQILCFARQLGFSPSNLWLPKLNISPRPLTVRISWKKFLSVLPFSFFGMSSQAQILIDDFSTGPYNFATSPFDPYYNGLTHSRFYIQSGSDILGGNRMVVGISNPNFPANSQFDGSIGSGLAVAQNTPGNDLGWEYDYGYLSGGGPAGSFPWQFSNLNANLSGYSTIQLSFASSSGNMQLRIGINTPSSYFPTVEFNIPNSATPFTYDVPLSDWSGVADLSDVNQLVFNFQPGTGGGADLSRIEVANPVPEPCTVCLGLAAVGLFMRRRVSMFG